MTAEPIAVVVLCSASWFSQVARNYVTQAGVIELKRDIVTELGRVEGRVEAQIDLLVEPRN